MTSPSFRFHFRADDRRTAFTLVELLTVITIIVILVGLIVGAAGFANTKAARSRAEGEIKALSAAAENYKSDNGIYPSSDASDSLDPRKQGQPTAYVTASRDLYALLSGQIDTNTGKPLTVAVYPPAPAAGARNYWGDLKPNMLGGVKDGVSAKVTAINDPWGFSYGYSTAYAKGVADNAAAVPPVTTTPSKGYNPTFDLWSVANKTTSASDTSTQQPVWITNW